MGSCICEWSEYKEMVAYSRFEGVVFEFGGCSRFLYGVDIRGLW